MNLRRAIRSVLAGTLLYILCRIYLPQVRMEIAATDVTIISVGLAGVFTFLVYRFS
ncbi:MAG TPA: hypothetical protein VMI94_23105 [Bryobacteraceae bacterium]|nr:hypothetical protein [Bryobacteraceae bacterium]